VRWQPIDQRHDQPHIFAPDVTGNLDHGIRRQAIDQVSAVLALFPTLPLRYPIKKWAAMACVPRRQDTAADGRWAFP
jgi:hypothetical protein